MGLALPYLREATGKPLWLMVMFSIDYKSGPLIGPPLARHLGNMMRKYDSPNQALAY